MSWKSSSLVNCLIYFSQLLKCGFLQQVLDSVVTPDVKISQGLSLPFSGHSVNVCLHHGWSRGHAILGGGFSLDHGFWITGLLIIQHDWIKLH